MRRITKLGSVLVGIGAGAAAVVWLIKDRLLGPETAPVSVDDAPAFRVAPSSSPAERSADADDLSEVKGIGPVYRARLEQAGVTTFAGLAAMTAEDVAEAAGVTADRAKDWLSQATKLAG
jgi:predicted flap endonuclease-1-like 5' DNA nuclease